MCPLTQPFRRGNELLLKTTYKNLGEYVVSPSLYNWLSSQCPELRGFVDEKFATLALRLLLVAEIVDVHASRERVEIFPVHPFTRLQGRGNAEQVEAGECGVPRGSFSAKQVPILLEYCLGRAEIPTHE